MCLATRNRLCIFSIFKIFIKLATNEYCKGAFTIDDLTKHDKYVDSLCSRIHPEYDLVFKNVPLYSMRRKTKRKVLLGEIDVLAFKDGHYDIFEVKCSRRITKARKQLLRIKKSLEPDKKIRNFYFFCGESGELHHLN